MTHVTNKHTLSMYSLNNYSVDDIIAGFLGSNILVHVLFKIFVGLSDLIFGVIVFGSKDVLQSVDFSLVAFVTLDGVHGLSDDNPD